jgi:hypothetical protein
MLVLPCFAGSLAEDRRRRDVVAPASREPVAARLAERSSSPVALRSGEGSL